MSITITNVELYNPFSVEKVGLWQRVMVKGERGNRLYRRVFRCGKKMFPNLQADAFVRIEGENRHFSYSVFNTQFHSLYDPLYAYGYEPETATLIRLLLRRAKHFVDVGSNWGYYPVYARACGFEGRITAFEPQRNIFNQMQNIIGKLGLTEGTKLLNQAAAARKMMVGVDVPDGIHSGLGVVCAGGDVEAIPLDDLLDESPDVIKIDAEGYEAEVLAGADRLLRELRPCLIFESWKNKNNVAETMRPLDYLSERDYSFFQPAFLKQTKSGVLPLLYGEYWDLEPEMELVLISFEVEQRFLMQRQINVLAVPKEKVEEMARSVLFA